MSGSIASKGLIARELGIAILTDCLLLLLGMGLIAALWHPTGVSVVIGTPNPITEVMSSRIEVNATYWPLLGAVLLAWVATLSYLVSSKGAAIRRGISMPRVILFSAVLLVLVIGVGFYYFSQVIGADVVR